MRAWKYQLVGEVLYVDVPEGDFGYRVFRLKLDADGRFRLEIAGRLAVDLGLDGARVMSKFFPSDL